MHDDVWKVCCLLIMIVGCLYWFSYRPHHIKDRCMAEATARYANVQGENTRAGKIDIAYQLCLEQNIY